MNSEQIQTDKSLELLTWFEVNKKKLLYGAIAVLVVGCGVYVAKHFAEQKELEATQALFALNKPAESGKRPAAVASADLLKVAQQYAGTKAAERAQLQAANALFGEKNYAEAKAKFEEFAGKYPESPLLATVEYGKAACLDAMNQPDQALAAYQQVTTRFATDPVAAQAKIAIGLIYEAQNKPDLALKAYREVSEGRNAMFWYREVSPLIEHLMLTHPQLAMPAAAPAPAAMTPGPAPVITPAPAKDKK